MHKNNKQTSKYSLQTIGIIYLILQITIVFSGGLQEIDNLAMYQEFLIGGQNIRYNDGRNNWPRHGNSLVAFDDNIFGMTYFRDFTPYVSFIQAGQPLFGELALTGTQTDQAGVGACKFDDDQMFVLYSLQGAENLHSRMVTKAGGTIATVGNQVFFQSTAIDAHCARIAPDLIGVTYMQCYVDDGTPGYDHPWGVFFQLYNVTSETYGARMQINDDGQGFQGDPDITLLNNNKVVICFYHTKDVNNLSINEYGVFLQELDLSGAKPPGATNIVVRNEPNQVGHPRMTSYLDLLLFSYSRLGDAYLRIFNDDLQQICEVNVGTGRNPIAQAHNNVVYYRFYNGAAESWVAEIFTNCTIKVQARLETNSAFKFQEDMAISASSDRVVLAYIQTHNSGASARVLYSEYFIEQYNTCSPNDQCAACYGPYTATCNVCSGTQEQRPLKRTDTGDCRCIDGYFFNGSTQNCEKCHELCDTCKSFDTCILYMERCLAPSDVGYNIQSASGTKVAGHLPSSSNNAYQFNGSTHVDLGSQTFGREVSISFWAKFTAFNANSNIFDCGQGHGVNNLIIKNVDITGQIMVEYFRDSQSNKQYSSHNAILNQWEHWTITIDDNGDIKIYKAGILRTNNGESYTNKRFRKEQRDNCYIGKPNNSSESNFQGELEQFRIYYRILQPQEISCLSQTSAYCEHQCGECAGTTPDTCESCAEPNREMGSSCQCKEGFYNTGTHYMCQDIQKAPEDYILEGRDSQNFGTTDAPGRLPGSNTAMIFNGLGQYRDFGTTNFAGEITISAWVRYDQFRQYSRIIDFGNGEDSDNIVFYNDQQTGQLQLAVFQGSSDHYQLGGTVNLGEWVHVVARKPAGQGQIFMDGIDTTSTTSSNQNFVPLAVDRTMSWIGRSQWENNTSSNDDWFEGGIDNLRIYNRILSDTEITYLTQIQTYCNRQCYHCENNFDNCNKCIGSNRDLNYGCKCLEGFYDNGSPDCQPIFPCYQRLSQLSILANDGDSIPGKLFHFNRQTVDAILGRNDWDNNMFNVVNLRTGQTKQIILFTNVNGGSVGDASGRLEPEVGTQQEFKVGDILELMGAAQCQVCAGKYRVLPYCNCVQGYYEVEGQNDCAPNSQNCDLFDTRIKVLSADSSQDSNPGFTTGMNFNFNAQEMDRILQNTSWDQSIVKITNMRTGYRSYVKLYRSTTNGGSVGDSYGKIIDNDPLQFSQRYITNDILDLQTQSSCIKCFGNNRRLPSCDCGYGYTDVDGYCQKNLPMGNYCQNFYHLQAQAGSNGYIKIFKNKELLTGLPQTAANDQKGITAVIIDKDDYSIVDKKIYDINTNAGDEAQFQTDIGALAADTIVLIGISDIGTGSNLSSVGIDTLKTLGANSALTIASQSSYVLLGKKGAVQGSRTEWYESEFPQVNSINLYQTSNVQQSFISGCIDNPYQAITYSTCHTVEELNLFDGVTAFKNQKTLPNLIQYTNIPHLIQDAVFLSGDQVLQSTSDCTITPGLGGEAYIFIEDEKNLYTSFLKDGDLELTLLDNGWTKLPEIDQTMKQLTVQTNEVRDVLIFRKSFTTEFIIPEIKIQEFTGGIAFKIKVCHETCLTCDGSGADQCLSCHTDQNRELNDENYCVCKSNHYDAFTSTGSYTCPECDDSIPQCYKPIQPSPVPTPTVPNIPAGDHYTVIIGDNKVPVSECQNNPNCDACNLQACTTCKGDNRDPNLYCLCSVGFYENPRTRECIPCSPRCKQCFQGPNNCVLCHEGDNRVNEPPTCACKDGYYENDDYKCITYPKEQLEEESNNNWLLAIFFATYVSIVAIMGVQYFKLKQKEKINSKIHSVKKQKLSQTELFDSKTSKKGDIEDNKICLEIDNKLNDNENENNSNKNSSGNNSNEDGDNNFQTELNIQTTQMAPPTSDSRMPIKRQRTKKKTSVADN